MENAGGGTMAGGSLMVNTWKQNVAGDGLVVVNTWKQNAAGDGL